MTPVDVAVADLQHVYVLHAALEPVRHASIRSAYQLGIPLPPVLVVRDVRTGECWLVDGHHRLTVAIELGLDTIAVRFIDDARLVRQWRERHEQHRDMVRRTLGEASFPRRASEVR